MLLRTRYQVFYHVYIRMYTWFSTIRSRRSARGGLLTRCIAAADGITSHGRTKTHRLCTTSTKSVSTIYMTISKDCRRIIQTSPSVQQYSSTVQQQYLSTFFFFVGLTFTFQLLDKLWSFVLPFPPRRVLSVFIAHRVQHSHCSSTFIERC